MGQINNKWGCTWCILKLVSFLKHQHYLVVAPYEKTLTCSAYTYRKKNTKYFTKNTLPTLLPSYFLFFIVSNGKTTRSKLVLCFVHMCKGCHTFAKLDPTTLLYLLLSLLMCLQLFPLISPLLSFCFFPQSARSLNNRGCFFERMVMLQKTLRLWNHCSEVSETEMWYFLNNSLGFITLLM